MAKQESQFTTRILFLLSQNLKLESTSIKRYLLKSQLITQMYENQAGERGDADPHDEIEKATNQLKSSKIPSQFQKNYPKNIFIPIIEYLADLGFKQDYERCVGTREQFQGKNVVSLSLIYQLLSQQWFNRNVNKRLLEANISNKILMNSKIKKKLFHLKVAKILLHSEAVDAKVYKKNVSRGANKIAIQIIEDDQLFQHPSSIIYLLNLFIDTLKILFKKNLDHRSNNQDSDISNSSVSKQVNSKQEFKFLTKSIIRLFNRVKCDKESLEVIQQKIKQLITERAKQINRKYQLSDNVPQWSDFYHCVVERCFQYKTEGQKITNSIFNQWIYQFKKKSGHIGLVIDRSLIEVPQIKFFTPTILILPPEE